MRILATLCAVAMAPLAFAGEAVAGDVLSFGAPSSITNGFDQPAHVASGDFDANGRRDVIVATSHDDARVFEGNGDGTFTFTQTLALNGTNGISIGEFNGDTDPDLAMVSTNSGVQILTGAAGVTFTAQASLPIGNFPTDVAVGEFNGDSDPDLAVSQQTGDTVSIFTGTGPAAATFAGPAAFAVGDVPNIAQDRPFEVTVGDFNLDGDPDLATANFGVLADTGSDTVSILTGAAGAAFSAPSNITVGDGPDDMVVGNFNGDSEPDIAVANGGSNTIGARSLMVLTGGAGASFTVSAPIGALGESLAVADFNNDGDPDLAAGSGATNSVAFYLGQAGSAFGPAQTFAGGPAANPSIDDITAGDFNNDLRPDIATASFSADTASLVLNTSDLTPPDTTIQTGPNGLTNDNTPTFTFTANETSTFQCRIVGVTAFAPCTSGFTPAAVPDGARTVEVLATDSAGNVETLAATRNFTVDATPPNTTIQTGPNGLTNDNTPTFTFIASETSTFQCRIVGVTTFAPCTSGFTPTAVPDGARTVEVLATDTAGNVETTAASRNFTVDTTPPDTTIEFGPSGPTNDNTLSYEFAAEPGATFECRLDGPGAATGTFAACGSPHVLPTLADGAYTFSIRATDTLGNQESSQTRQFTVDTAAPDSAISGGPTGSTTETAPTFTFTANEPGSFACSLDGAPPAPCSSPHSTGPLAPGAHTFTVRAADAAGNVEPTPASRSFSIVPPVRKPPPPPILGKAVNVEPVTGTVFVSVPNRIARVAQTVPGLKGRRFVPLTEARQIAVGSFLDTRRGTVSLTAGLNSKGSRTQASRFSSGVFEVLQSRKRKERGTTELRLKGSSFSRCSTGKRSSPATAARSKRRIRRLRGSGKGRFRTRGRYSAATVRGTIWTVTDRCDGTLTEVKRGRVAVRDFRRKKTITLRTGKRYLARPRR